MGDPTAAARAVNRHKRDIARGTIDPSPGGRRLLPLPKVMATPPTVGTPNQSASTITSGRVLKAWAPTDSALRRLSPPAVEAAGTTGFNVNATIPLKGSGSPSVVTASGQVWDFMHDGDNGAGGSAFEVVFRDQGPSGGTGLRVMVDGEWVSETDVDFVWPNNGSYYYTKYTFADQRPRHITIEVNGQNFYGIVVGPTDAVWQPHTPAGPVVAFFGDSYTEGARLLLKGDTYGHWCGRALGWKRTLCSGRGSTGYLQTLVGSGYPKLRDRVTSDLVPHAPEIVIVCAGINDQANWSKAAVKTEAQLLYQAIRAGLPGVTLIATGPWSPTGHPTGVATFGDGYMNINDAIREACSEEDVTYIDTIGGPYPYDGNVSHYYDLGAITGTGTVQTPVATGNSSRYIGTMNTSDVTHPSPAGQKYLGLWLAGKIAAELPL